jgi:hypothetical protein
MADECKDKEKEPSLWEVFVWFLLALGAVLLGLGFLIAGLVGALLGASVVEVIAYFLCWIICWIVASWLFSLLKELLDRLERYLRFLDMLLRLKENSEHFLGRLFPKKKRRGELGGGQGLGAP